MCIGTTGDDMMIYARVSVHECICGIIVSTTALRVLCNVHVYIPYSWKYWRGIIFGGLADFGDYYSNCIQNHSDQ